jgi:twitching motility protein PilT
METAEASAPGTASMLDLMQQALDLRASDIHIKTGNPPIFRIDGTLTRMEGDPLTEEDAMGMLTSICADSDVAKFKKIMELDSSYVMEGVARFRVNACKEDGDTRIVLRLIPLKILTVEELDLPPVLKDIVAGKNGLILVTGPTGSGKSTTLAAMINHVNENRPEHIITVEDPLEFVHADKKSIITQREVGHDTLSFANALRGALRQDPDIILIGEMRDAETVRTAMASAETGHLVFSTLHTVDAVETIHRIIDFFEPHQQVQIRKQLGSVIRAIVSQRICPVKDGEGRCAACEILIGTRAVRDFIEVGKGLKDIARLIEGGYDQYRMQTFDQALFDLYKAGKITPQIALQFASSAKDLKLRIQGMG